MMIPIIPIYQNNLCCNSFRVNEKLRILSVILNTKVSISNFKRALSTKGTSNDEVETKQLVFEGPNFRLIRILKIFSITTFGVCVHLFDEEFDPFVATSKNIYLNK